MGLLSDKVLKGVKSIEFKYGGPHVELSESLYRLGLLSKDPVNVNGVDIVPMDLVLKLCPPAPKFPDEIKQILDEGLVMEEGAFLVRVDGTRDGKRLRSDSYVNAPGLVEAFETSGLSHEAYLTGQCAAVFVRMMVDDAFADKGLFVPEQLPADARRYCFRKLTALKITVDNSIELRNAP
jgi:saccharopine dehydrogenase-like NADP-dependent oxidoreductase